VSLDLEVPISKRGTKGELGFDLGLPRAAITTLTLDQAPAKVKTIVVGTRTAEAVVVVPRLPEMKRANLSVDQLIGKALPLGATDIVEVTWDAPTTATTSEVALSAESDVKVRIDETQVETEAKIRLRGPTREWLLTLPVGADVNVDRAGGGPTGTSTTEPTPTGMTATVVRPTDPNKPTWLIRLPTEVVASDWVATVSVRQSRPKVGDVKYRGPYPVGPFSLPATVRHHGKVSVQATAGVRVGFKPLAEFRRQDLPAGADEDLVAVFTFASLPVVSGSKPAAWMELDARQAVAVPRVRPTHKWTLTSTGWKLDSAIRVTPPPRGEVDQLVVELPATWLSVEAGPDIVDEVVVIKQTPTVRTLGIRLKTPARANVELTLTALVPPAVGGREMSIQMPRFFHADERDLTRYLPVDERDTKLQVSVPDGFEVRATAVPWDANPSLPSDTLKPMSGAVNPHAAVTVVGGEFDRGAGRIDVAWQPYRPELNCDIRAEVTVQERQFTVTQTFKFRRAADDAKPIRLRGPALVGLQSNPPLDPIASGEWEFRPPADAKEFTLNVSFAVRSQLKPEGLLAVPVQLMWPETATRVDTVLRVWGGGTRRAERFEGPWRELPTEVAVDRDSLPWYTLSASGVGVPLRLDIPEGSVAGAVQVERALVQAILGDDGGCGIRARFLLRKYPSTGLDVELPTSTAMEMLVDDKRVEPKVVATHADGSPKLVHVPLTESKPGRAFVTLEVRCQTTAARERGRRFVVAPALVGAQFRSPIRWYMSTPASVSPLYLVDGSQPEVRWVWRGVGFAPMSAVTPAELDHWYAVGSEDDQGDADTNSTTVGDTFAARQPAVGPVEVILLPRIGWIGGCAAIVFVVGFLLSRLQPWLLGPVLGVVGVIVAVLAVRFPHPAAQAAAAAQPGLFALAVLLGGQAAWRWYARRRIEHLPGFSRVVPNSGFALAAMIPPPQPGTASRPNRGPGSVHPPDDGGSTVPPSAAAAAAVGR